MPIFSSSYLRGRITLALYRKMGWSECVVDSAEQYIELAVRLAGDGGFRRSIRERLQAASPVLFEDLEEVRALESLLAGVACETRAATL